MPGDIYRDHYTYDRPLPPVSATPFPPATYGAPLPPQHPLDSNVPRHKPQSYAGFGFPPSVDSFRNLGPTPSTQTWDGENKQSSSCGDMFTAFGGGFREEAVSANASRSSKKWIAPSLDRRDVKESDDSRSPLASEVPLPLSAFEFHELRKKALDAQLASLCKASPTMQSAEAYTLSSLKWNAPPQSHWAGKEGNDTKSPGPSKASFPAGAYQSRPFGTQARKEYLTGIPIDGPTEQPAVISPPGWNSVHSDVCWGIDAYLIGSKQSRESDRDTSGVPSILPFGPADWNIIPKAAAPGQKPSYDPNWGFTFSPFQPRTPGRFGFIDEGFKSQVEDESSTAGRSDGWGATREFKKTNTGRGSRAPSAVASHPCECSDPWGKACEDCDQCQEHCSCEHEAETEGDGFGAGSEVSIIDTDKSDSNWGATKKAGKSDAGWGGKSDVDTNAEDESNRDSSMTIKDEARFSSLEARVAALELNTKPAETTADKTIPHLERLGTTILELRPLHPSYTNLTTAFLATTDTLQSSGTIALSPALLDIIAKMKVPHYDFHDFREENDEVISTGAKQASKSSSGGASVRTAHQDRFRFNFNDFREEDDEVCLRAADPSKKPHSGAGATGRAGAQNYLDITDLCVGSGGIARPAALPTITPQSGKAAAANPSAIHYFDFFDFKEESHKNASAEAPSMPEPPESRFNFKDSREEDDEFDGREASSAAKPKPQEGGRSRGRPRGWIKQQDGKVKVCGVCGFGGHYSGDCQWFYPGW